MCVIDMIHVIDVILNVRRSGTVGRCTTHTHSTHRHDQRDEQRQHQNETHREVTGRGEDGSYYGMGVCLFDFLSVSWCVFVCLCPLLSCSSLVVVVASRVPSQCEVILVRPTTEPKRKNNNKGRGTKRRGGGMATESEEKRGVLREM